MDGRGCISGRTTCDLLLIHETTANGRRNIRDKARNCEGAHSIHEVHLANNECPHHGFCTSFIPFLTLVDLRMHEEASSVSGRFLLSDPSLSHACLVVL
jgi:hypothetical protein